MLQMLRYSITFLPLIKIILNELLSFFVHAWHVCWLIYAKYLAKCNVFLDNRHFLLNFICCNSAIAARGHLIYFDICAFGWIYVPNLNERYTFIILSFNSTNTYFFLHFIKTRLIMDILYMFVLCSATSCRIVLAINRLHLRYSHRHYFKMWVKARVNEVIPQPT